MKIIKIADKEYAVKYSINSLIEMEQYLGQPFTKIFSEGGVSLLTLRTLVYFGMKQMNKDLTHEKAGEIISDALESGKTFDELILLFAEELNKSLGVKDNPETKN